MVEVKTAVIKPKFSTTSDLLSVEVVFGFN